MAVPKNHVFRGMVILDWIFLKAIIRRLENVEYGSLIDQLDINLSTQE